MVSLQEIFPTFDFCTRNSINFEVKYATNLRDIFFMMKSFYYFKYSVENVSSLTF